MRKLFAAFLCICLLMTVSAVQAEDEGFHVTYIGNNCLASVPEDETVYQKGETVTVLFEPVTYTDNQIFYGWDMNADGITEFGYAYNQFTMPEKDVELKAICIPYYPQPQRQPLPPCDRNCTPAPVPPVPWPDPWDYTWSPWGDWYISPNP